MKRFCNRCEGHGTLLPPWEDDEKPICEQCRGSGFEVIANTRWTWQDCQALAALLNASLGNYRNASQCYESLLSLQRDRLARLSDAEAIAAGQTAKQQLF